MREFPHGAHGLLYWLRGYEDTPGGSTVVLHALYPTDIDPDWSAWRRVAEELRLRAAVWIEHLRGDYEEFCRVEDGKELDW